MRKILFLLCFLTLAFVFSGCRKEEEKNAAGSWDPNVAWDGTPPAQEAIPDFFEDVPDSNVFPESMVGVWKTGLVQPPVEWEIKFEQDGTIKKIVHTLAGPVNIEEGGVEANKPDEGAFYVFAMGPCEAGYVPETGMVKVKIIVDYFIFSFPAGKVEGRMEDYFEGPVSEDGKTWETEWRSFGWLKEASLPDFDMIKANPVPLIFIKSDPNLTSEE